MSCLHCRQHFHLCMPSMRLLWVVFKALCMVYWKTVLWGMCNPVIMTITWLLAACCTSRTVYAGDHCTASILHWSDPGVSWDYSVCLLAYFCCLFRTILLCSSSLCSVCWDFFTLQGDALPVCTYHTIIRSYSLVRTKEDWFNDYTSCDSYAEMMLWHSCWRISLSPGEQYRTTLYIRISPLSYLPLRIMCVCLLCVCGNLMSMFLSVFVA